DSRLKEPADDGLGSFQAPVEEQRPADRFERIRENRLAPEPAGFQLTGTQLQLVPDPYGSRYFGQRLGAHEACAQAAQVALGRRWESQVQMPCDDEVQDRITEELEALVIRTRGAAMRQGRDKEIGVSRLMSEPFANPPQAIFSRRHRHP